MKSSQVYQKLANSGPTPADEMPTTTFSPQVKQDGVRSFNPTSIGYKGGSKSGGGQASPVYYIHGKHDPGAVVREWLRANEKTLEAVGKWAVHHRICDYGDEFKVASRRILGPFENGGDYESNTGETSDPCPFCGEEDIRSFPVHRPECPEL